MTTQLLLVGISHRTAPIEVRDRLALAGDELPARRAELVGEGELVVLSTCNRLEIYVAVNDCASARQAVLTALACVGGLEPRVVAAAMTSRVGDDVVGHLCRVAAGLDSPIVGEPEILGQVRGAFAAAERSRTAGVVLRRLFACAVRAGRRARSETGLSESSASLAAVTSELAAEELGELGGRTVLLVGAGAMGELVGRCFRARGCEVVVTSRTLAGAAALAARIGGRASGLDTLERELGSADVLVSCTRSPCAVLTADLIARARRPLLVIDLALPRDVDPAVASLPGCRLVDLDGVYRYAGAPSVDVRRAVDAAEAIASVEADRFCARQTSAAAAITSLRSRAESIRTAELARIEPKLGRLSPEQWRAVEKVTAQIVNKLLHEPTVRVKDGAQLVPALRELFALEDAA